MNSEESKYLDLLREIMETGSRRQDRTGVGTLSLFGTRLRFSLENGKIPMLTTKKMFARGVVEELLFFLRGETDTTKLEAKGVNIWKGNTSRAFLDKCGLKNYPEGEMGKMYGFQWREFGSDRSLTNPNVLPRYHGVDQLAELIRGLMQEPHSRRHLMLAWNPQQLNEMVLPPCHPMVQFYVDEGQLSCQFYMRSSDAFLGKPFNLMSYAVMTHILAKLTGTTAKELIYVGGDDHIYLNHIEQVKEQLTREPYEFPTLTIHKSLSSIQDLEELRWSDFQITGYQSHPAITAEMAV